MNRTPIVLVTGRYQLGDDPGLFQDALYVGHELSLPFTRTWDSGGDITLKFYTHDVETWADWQGHRVTINNTEIGFLKDDAAEEGGAGEMIPLLIPAAKLQAALSGNDRFLLNITLGTQKSTPGMADDFVLWRIESDGTFAAKLGWK